MLGKAMNPVMGYVLLTLLLSTVREIYRSSGRMVPGEVDGATSTPPDIDTLISGIGSAPPQQEPVHHQVSVVVSEKKKSPVNITIKDDTNRLVDLERRNHTQTSTSSSQHADSLQTSNETKYYYLHIAKTAGHTMSARLSSNEVPVFQGTFKPVTNLMYQAYKEHPGKTVFMTEGDGFSSYPLNHSLTMLRDPMHHVVSQYFHCTESPDNLQWQEDIANVSLEQWLEYWVKQKLTVNNGTKYERAFSCYTPINMQGTVIGWDGTKEHLKSLFDILGAVEHLELSKCLMLIHILGRVPDVCNCSTPSTNQHTSSKWRRRRLGEHDHGVTHHGASYTLSDHEQSLLRILTDKDRDMYQIGLEIMYETTRKLEKRYNVSICASGKR